jgi:hypothetical protein
MNRFMLYGGFAGFIVVFITGLAYKRDLNDLLLDAMIGCFVIGFLSRLLYRKLETFAVKLLQDEQQEASSIQKNKDKKK